MTQRVYISQTNDATFTCPKCERTITVNVASYAALHKSVKVRSRCTCGHTWVSILEKRKQYRKQVHLTGTYKQFVSGNPVDKGRMTIVDISKGGLKLKVDRPAYPFDVGHRLDVEFELDNRRKTLIRRSVFVKNIDGPFVGTAFSETDVDDPALGFYLLG